MGEEKQKQKGMNTMFLIGRGTTEVESNDYITVRRGNTEVESNAYMSNGRGEAEAESNAFGDFVVISSSPVEWFL